jgi:hypothetical protein
MSKKKLIPFGWLPASWGLSGKTRQIAEAEYMYSGIELEKKLAAIEHSDPTDYLLAVLKIDLQANQIDQYCYDTEVNKIENPDDDQRQLVQLEIEFKHNKIDQTSFEKKKASLKNEPWVTVLNMGIDQDQVTQGYFELDWNDQFVTMLQEAGIQGTSDEDIVNKWFNDVCKTVLLQQGADLDYGLQEINTAEREDVEFRRNISGQTGPVNE